MVYVRKTGVHPHPPAYLPTAHLPTYLPLTAYLPTGVHVPTYHTTPIQIPTYPVDLYMRTTHTGTPTYPYLPAYTYYPYSLSLYTGIPTYYLHIHLPTPTYNLCELIIGN